MTLMTTEPDWGPRPTGDAPCAYCGKITPIERQASPTAWLWPGKGWVVNCVACAGPDALGAKVAAVLERRRNPDPIPFYALAPRVKGLSEQEIYEGLRWLAEADRAVLVYGLGWQLTRRPS